MGTVGKIFEGFSQISLHQSEAAINHLPQDLILDIFKFLPTKNLSELSIVCKKWKMLSGTVLNRHLQILQKGHESFDLFWKAFLIQDSSSRNRNMENLSLKIIDEKVWKECFNLQGSELDFTNAPACNKCLGFLLPTIKKFASLEIKRKEMMLLTLPAGLTLNKFIDLTKNQTVLKNQALQFFPLFWPITAWGDVAIEKTCLFAIASFFNGSKNLSYEDQKELVSKNQCEMPTLLPMVVFRIFNYLTTNSFDGSGSGSNYSRCSDTQNGSQYAIVGECNKYGLHMTSFNKNPRPDIGVVAFQKVDLPFA